MIWATFSLEIAQISHNVCCTTIHLEFFVCDIFYGVFYQSIESGLSFRFLNISYFFQSQSFIENWCDYFFFSRCDWSFIFCFFYCCSLFENIRILFIQRLDNASDKKWIILLLRIILIFEENLRISIVFRQNSLNFWEEQH